jgi:dienelactone hydrolase
MKIHLLAGALLLSVCGRAVAATNPNAKRDAQWRADVMKVFHVPAVLRPLHAKTWSSFSPAAGVKADRVTYDTADGMVVTAIVYMPDPLPAGKMPGLVVVNGHGGDKSSWYAYWSGIEFARAGAMVVTYDPIGEFERNIDGKSQASSHDTLPLPYGRHLAGLMQVDAMQAVTYLTQRREVDAKRIGLLGFSMGSFVGGITGAIDLRIHAVVLSGGGIYGDAGSYWDRGVKPCQVPASRELLQVMPGADRGAILYTLNADRGPMLVMDGTADKVMDIPFSGADWLEKTREKTIALHGTDENVFTSVIYPDVGHRPSWVDADGFLWISDHLHFANWTHAQIAALPVTHISAWAKANGVTVVSEAEGSLMALGDDVPALTREQLTVLPTAARQELKPRLTFESWEAKIEKEYPPEPVPELPVGVSTAK